MRSLVGRYNLVGYIVHRPADEFQIVHQQGRHKRQLQFHRPAAESVVRLGGLHVGIQLGGCGAVAAAHKAILRAIHRQIAPQREMLEAPVAQVLVVEPVCRAPGADIGVDGDDGVCGCAQAVALGACRHKCCQGNQDGGEKSFHGLLGFYQGKDIAIFAL